MQLALPSDEEQFWVEVLGNSFEAGIYPRFTSGEAGPDLLTFV